MDMDKDYIMDKARPWAKTMSFVIMGFPIRTFRHELRTNNRILL